MKRDELFTRLQNSMTALGKGIYHEEASLTDCSPAQNHVLMIVSSHESISVKQLAELLKVTSGAATQHIGALEKAGLLTRSINLDNRREVVVKTTAKGSAAIQTIQNTKSRLLSQVFAELDDEELQTLVSLVEKVSNKYVKDKGAM